MDFNNLPDEFYPTPPERKNPPYQPYHCFTVVMCKECGEFYEPICKLPHKCKKQNSYPIDKAKEN